MPYLIERGLKWKKIDVPGYRPTWYAKLNYAQWVRLLEVTEGMGEWITVDVPAKPDVDGNQRRGG